MGWATYVSLILSMRLGSFLMLCMRGTWFLLVGLVDFNRSVGINVPRGSTHPVEQVHCFVIVVFIFAFPWMREGGCEGMFLCW